MSLSCVERKLSTICDRSGLSMHHAGFPTRAEQTIPPFASRNQLCANCPVRWSTGPRAMWGSTQPSLGPRAPTSLDETFWLSLLSFYVSNARFAIEILNVAWWQPFSSLHSCRLSHPHQYWMCLHFILTRSCKGRGSFLLVY